MWYHADTITLMAMTLRLTAEQDTRLQALAETLGVSRQQAIIVAVDEALENRDHSKRFEEAKRFVLTEYADLIKRLGE